MKNGTSVPFFSWAAGDSDAQQVHLEHQRGVGRDHAAGTAGAVAQVGGMVSTRVPPTFMPCTPSSQPRMTSPPPRPKQRAGRGPCCCRTSCRGCCWRGVVEPAGVVHTHALAGHGFGAVPGVVSSNCRPEGSGSSSRVSPLGQQSPNDASPRSPRPFASQSAQGTASGHRCGGGQAQHGRRRLQRGHRPRQVQRLRAVLLAQLVAVGASTSGVCR
jgi:hypothetical protein